MRGCRSFLEVSIFTLPSPPLVEEDDVFVPGLLQLVEDVVPPVHQESLFVEGGVAVYVSRGRAYRSLTPSPPLPPRGYDTDGFRMSASLWRFILLNPVF